MSDEQYRAERRTAEQEGLYETTAVKALRAGDVDGLRELLLEKIPAQLVKNIISTHPSLSYRRVEWEENPTRTVSSSTINIPIGHLRKGNLEKARAEAAKSHTPYTTYCNLALILSGKPLIHYFGEQDD